MPPNDLPSTAGLDLCREQVEPRELPLGRRETQSAADQQNQHAASLPVSPVEENRLTRKVIDLEKAVTAHLRRLEEKQKVHHGTVLEAKKIEMYDRWKKGLDILPLRNNYRDPVSKLTPSAKSVQHALRYVAVTREEGLLRTIENQRLLIRELQTRRTG